MPSSSTGRQRGRIGKRAGLTVALALVAIAAFPAIASAGSVTSSGSVITYTGDGSGDTVTVDDAGVDSYTFAENGNTASGGCTLNAVPNPDVITCSGTDWTSVVMNMGNGSDNVNAAAVDGTADPADPFTMNGGTDGDTLTAGSADDTINGDTGNEIADGGSGNDEIFGGADPDNLSGNSGEDHIFGELGGDTINAGGSNDALSGGADGDTMNGQAGVDRLDGGTHDDVLEGGPDPPDTGSVDRVLYSGNLYAGGPAVTCSEGGSASTTITIGAGGMNDSGCNGDTDNVSANIESVTGSIGTDSITGDGSAETLAGAAGNDTLNGGGGNDFMGGSQGNDVMNGNTGTDTVTYTTSAGTCTTAAPAGISITMDDVANDTDCLGSTQDDVGGDIEVVNGGPRNDTINAAAADQAVTLNCGAGTDTVFGSPFADTFNPDCENQTP